jgi:hypothetical protein
VTDQDGWKGRAPVPAGGLGPILALLNKLNTRVNNLETSSSLISAAISKGGLTVRDGGGIAVQDGGGITARDGGEITAYAADNVGYARMVDAAVEFSYSADEDTPARLLAGDSVFTDGSHGSGLWIYPPRNVDNDDDPTQINLFGPKGTGQPGGMWLRSDGAIAVASSRSIFANADTYAELTAGSDGVRVSADGGQASLEGESVSVIATGASLTASGGDLHATSSSDTVVSAGGNATVVADATSFLVGGAVTVQATGSAGIYLSPGSGGLSMSPVATTGAGANAVWDQSGQLLKSTSSRRYKTDIADYTPDPAHVLALRPRTFRTDAEVAALGDKALTYVGYIAEEVADAGLTELVVLDDKGRPDALSYDRMLAAYHAVIVQQQQTITDLAERVAALEETRKEATS